mmetsp:Transcript_6797/g.41485  ORF Transcript_6797/g.41485 Transcript_6797/m.41485 type:complete len:375 (+) Transcript_6797:539-1663(+)
MDPSSSSVLGRAVARWIRHLDRRRWAWPSSWTCNCTCIVAWTSVRTRRACLEGLQRTEVRHGDAGAAEPEAGRPAGPTQGRSAGLGTASGTHETKRRSATAARHGCETEVDATARRLGGACRAVRPSASPSRRASGRERPLLDVVEGRCAPRRARKRGAGRRRRARRSSYDGRDASGAREEDERNVLRRPARAPVSNGSVARLARCGGRASQRRCDGRKAPPSSCRVSKRTREAQRSRRGTRAGAAGASRPPEHARRRAKRAGIGAPEARVRRDKHQERSCSFQSWRRSKKSNGWKHHVGCGCDESPSRIRRREGCAGKASRNPSEGGRQCFARKDKNKRGIARVPSQVRGSREVFPRGSHETPDKTRCSDCRT